MLSAPTVKKVAKFRTIKQRLKPEGVIQYVAKTIEVSRITPVEAVTQALSVQLVVLPTEVPNNQERLVETVIGLTEPQPIEMNNDPKKSERKHEGQEKNIKTQFFQFYHVPDCTLTPTFTSVHLHSLFPAAVFFVVCFFLPYPQTDTAQLYNTQS